MKKIRKVKKGFTLVELIMAISTFAILLVTMSAGFIYINKSNGFSIKKSSSSYTLRSIRDYIINEKIDNSSVLSYTNSTLYKNDKDELENDIQVAIFRELPYEVLEFSFENDTQIYYCTISYSVNEIPKTYKFITYIKK